MSQDAQQDHVSQRTVVYRIHGTEDVRVRRDEPYQDADSGPLTMDVYYPPDSTGAQRLPVVVNVAGFPDAGYEKALGRKFKDMGSSTSWARLIARSGMIAVTYTNREPAADLQALLAWLRQHAASLGIDENRIGLWASSGNVPLALWILMQESGMKCAVLCYGYMLDGDGSSGVAGAAAAWGFVNPAAGKSIEDLPGDVPLFIARAGQDRLAHLNERLDRFVAGALTRNLPVTVVNHPSAPHAFDLFDDSERSRHIIREILTFMRFNLSVEDDL